MNNDNSINKSFNFVDIDENKQLKLEITREAFKNLAERMYDLCDDDNSFRFNNAYARLQEAKFWFIEAICKD